MKRTRSNLRRRLLRALLAVATVPVLIVSLVDIRTSYMHGYAASAARLENRALDVQQDLDDYVAKHVQAVESLARDVPPARNLDPAAWRGPMLNYHQVYPGFLTMIAADRMGRVILAIRGNGPGHSLVATTDNVADRDYFKRAIAQDGPYVSGVFQGRGLGQDPLVAISRSFAGPAGRAAGVVEGSLDLREFERFVKGSATPDTSGIVILDAHDYVTYASATTPFRVLQRISGSALLAPHAGSVFRYSHPHAGPVRDYLVGRSPERSAYGWQVFVFEPASALRRLILEIVAGGAICLLVAGLTCFLIAGAVASSITRPVEHLTRHVQVMVAGGAVQASPHLRLAAIRPGTPLEIVELSAGFASMAERLSESYAALRGMNDDLEQHVAERTADLERSNRDLALRDRAMAATTEGIAIADACLPDQPLIYVNSGFERLTGYSAAEVLGRNCRFLQGPLTDAPTARRLKGAILRREACTVELLNYRKDGSQFWNRLSLTPVQDASGAVTHFIGVQVDITPHKELERLKNELISTVSHELRTPLTSLLGFTELLLQRHFSPERSREFLRIVHRESKRLTAMINDFLDIQRVESGRLSFQLEEFALAPLVTEAAQVYFGADSLHRLAVSLADPALLVRADRDRLRQVLDNLLSNACKFSPKGGVVEVGSRRQASEVLVWVRDEGIGIPPEAIPQLFTRFFRVDNTETRRIGGTGLGLELAKRIVESMQGKIWVVSRPGAGTTFYFTLPLALPAPAESPLLPEFCATTVPAGIPPPADSPFSTPRPLEYLLPR